MSETWHETGYTGDKYIYPEPQKIKENDIKKEFEKEQELEKKCDELWKKLDEQEKQKIREKIKINAQKKYGQFWKLTISLLIERNEILKEILNEKKEI